MPAIDIVFHCCRPPGAVFTFITIIYYTFTLAYIYCLLAIIFAAIVEEILPAIHIIHYHGYLPYIITLHHAFITICRLVILPHCDIASRRYSNNNRRIIIAMLHNGAYALPRYAVLLWLHYIYHLLLL